MVRPCGHLRDISDVENLTMRSLSPTGGAMLMATLLTGCGAETAPTAVSGEPAAVNTTSPSPRAAPTIGLSPTSLGFFMHVFRPLQPPSQALEITNTGGRTLAWTATSNRGWLQIGPNTGTTPSTVTVSLDRAALPIGINGYRPSSLEASITVSAVGASNTPQKVPVTLILSYVP